MLWCVLSKTSKEMCILCHFQTFTGSVEDFLVGIWWIPSLVILRCIVQKSYFSRIPADVVIVRFLRCRINSRFTKSGDDVWSLFAPFLRTRSTIRRQHGMYKVDTQTINGQILFIWQSLQLVVLDITIIPREHKIWPSLPLFAIEHKKKA